MKRTIEGETVRHVEFIEDFFAEDDVTEDAFFVDGGFTYNGVATTTPPVIEHLKGETVDVLADGRPLLDQVISSAGVLTLDIAASLVQIGHRFTSELRTLRQIPQDTEGTAQGKLGNISHLTLRLYRSLGGEYGTDQDNLYNLGRLLIPAGLKTDVVATPFSGDIDLPFEGTWDTESGILIRTGEPLPFSLLALLPSINKGDRPDRSRGGVAR